jgi:integrase
MRASGPASTARDRVDSSRGVLLLEAEHTKRKRRREVSTRQAVYDVLAALPGPREGRVWPSGDIRTLFENAVAQAKLGDFHFHEMRHSFASWFVIGAEPPGAPDDPGPPEDQDAQEIAHGLAAREVIPTS